jgi:hypothetical protein
MQKKRVVESFNTATDKFCRGTEENHADIIRIISFVPRFERNLDLYGC